MELIPVRPSHNPIQTVQIHEDKKVSLEYLFDNLDFLFVWKTVMPKYHLRGKSCDPIAIFKALLLKEMRQISSKRKLAMFLRKNKFWLRKCGFEEPPHHDTFSKFIDRVGADSFEYIFDHLVKRVGEIRNIGRVVAVDSTLIKAYSRSHKNNEPSDPDAKWGYDPNNEGWVFGYKLHLAVDAELELPLVFTVTPANVYDSVEYPNLLQRLLSKRIKPDVIIADAGYDSKKNYLITLAEDIIPIITLNPRNLKYKKKRDFEKILPIQRDSKFWSQLYKKRGSVERVISRLKEELALKAVRVRGIANVKVHVALSLITMLTVALAAIKTENGHLSKSVNSFRF
jgi:transposase